MDGEVEMAVQTKQQAQWHSRHGGMWIDRLDFESEIAARLGDGRLSPHLEASVRQLQRDGYTILPGAADPQALDAFERDISRAFREGHDALILQLPADPTPRRIEPGMSRRATRVVDCFAVLPSALDLLASARLVELMGAVFDETPLLFQSLSFDMGSEQGLHQDTAYVVVKERPLELLACWIALEDVHPDSGPLEYLRGSHRLGDFDFNGRKHWNPEEDGPQIHHEWCHWITQEGERRGMERESFLARRGDILVWHADLAHGGSVLIDQERTRKSLVGHFCPNSATPHFMTYLADRDHRARHGALAYCSSHYDLAAMQDNADSTPQEPDRPASSMHRGWASRITAWLTGKSAPHLR